MKVNMVTLYTINWVRLNTKSVGLRQDPNDLNIKMMPCKIRNPSFMYPK